MKKFFFLLLFLMVHAFSEIEFEEVMTRKQMEQTGIDQLNYTQKKALEEWINNNFEPKQSLVKQNEQLYLSFNINEGEKLELSDGSTYEIAPEDRLYTIYWITPFPVKLGRSNNPKYPVKITNMNTGTSVKGRQVSTQEMLKEAEARQKALPPPKQPQPTPSPAPTPPKRNNTMKKNQQQPSRQNQQ